MFCLMDHLNKPTLPIIANEIIQNLNSLTNEDYLSLHSIFGETFTRSLELIDTAKFTLCTTKDGFRSIIQIEGNSNQLYNLYLNVNYCSCPAFKYQVLLSSQELTCKHVLAAKLAIILDKCTKQILTSTQIMNIVKISLADESEIRIEAK